VGLVHAESCDPSAGCTCEPGAILLDPKHKPADEVELWGRWIKCDGCDDWWCLAHDGHVFECACPSVHDFQDLEAVAG
tara:strand:- start:417 stop:650 length:234 start_codon:yes stop_codon:yes gene_type:complete